LMSTESANFPVVPARACASVAGFSSATLRVREPIFRQRLSARRFWPLRRSPPVAPMMDWTDYRIRSEFGRKGRVTARHDEFLPAPLRIRSMTRYALRLR
jgi:hypothetical protein